jgi:hypothetical protein
MAADDVAGLHPSVGHGGRGLQMDGARREDPGAAGPGDDPVLDEDVLAAVFLG